MRLCPIDSIRTLVCVYARLGWLGSQATESLACSLLRTPYSVYSVSDMMANYLAIRGNPAFHSRGVSFQNGGDVWFAHKETHLTGLAHRRSMCYVNAATAAVNSTFSWCFAPASAGDNRVSCIAFETVASAVTCQYKHFSYRLSVLHTCSVL